MKIRFLLTAIALWLTMFISARAQQTETYLRCVAFYNLENLFDTIHDEGKNDYEYLPDGGMKWNSLKYEHKLMRMAEAVAQLGTDEDPRGEHRLPSRPLQRIEDKTQPHV